MRLNQFLALHTALSRRGADKEIEKGTVDINGLTAKLGDSVSENDVVTWNNTPVTPETLYTTIILNKPVGYVCSKKGQGNKTIYNLLPEKYHNLNPVGRLDKDSSGLLLLTNDGELANRLTHPRYSKQKVYEISLDKPLKPLHQQMINDYGIQLEDGLSKLVLTKLDDKALKFEVRMSEGRNRQIRRTFAALGYTVKKLHRTQFGNYAINTKEGKFQKIL